MFANVIRVDLSEVYGEEWKGCEFGYKRLQHKSLVELQRRQAENPTEETEDGKAKVSLSVLEYMAELCRDHFIAGKALDDKREVVEVSAEQYAQYFQDTPLVIHVVGKLTNDKGLASESVKPKE